MYTELCEVDEDFAFILALVSAKLCCFLFFRPGHGRDLDIVSPVAAKMTPVTGVVSKATFKYRDDKSRRFFV